jgi:4-hydroxybenzoate polyprenyltransferase
MNDERDESEVPGDLEERLGRYGVGRGGRSSLQDYVELIRLPNVFTAVADVAMGFLFVQATGTEWTPTPWDYATLGTLIAASAALYMAGIVLNDVFDLDIDRQERPERPIPSGRVPFDAARRLGWRLLFLGVALASGTVFLTGHLRPGVAAAVLATAILLYDAWLKRTPLGPLAMGACRMLNVLLGMSAVEGTLHAEHWLVAGAIGVYVAGITLFARTEARRSGRLQLATATVVMVLGILMLAALPRFSHRLIPEIHGLLVGIQRWYVLIALMGAVVLRRFLHAIADPTPRRVQLAVSQGIISIVMLDAVACYSVRGVFWATLIVLLIFPAAFLRRRASMT